MLFMSWDKWARRRGGAAVAAAHAPSKTDYSYYAEHFTPKLTLTERADRVAKRGGGGGGGTGGGGVKRQRGSV